MAVFSRFLAFVVAAAAAFFSACGDETGDDRDPTPLLHFAHADRQEGVLEMMPRVVYWQWDENRERQYVGELITEQQIISAAAFDWFKPSCAPFVHAAWFERVKRSVYFDLLAELPLRSLADAAAVRAEAEPYDIAQWYEAPTDVYWVVHMREMSELGLNALSSEERARIPDGVTEAMGALGFAVFAEDVIDSEGKAGELLRYLRDQGELALRAAVEEKRPECMVEALE